MADEGYDLNPMQANLGLSGRGSFNPVGMPTPPVALPVVLHPGEVSRNVVQQSQSQAIQTIQSANMMRPTPPGYAPGAPQPMNAMGAWSSAYANNMAQINSQLIGSPFYAQAMAGISGGMQFNGSMMPSPVQFTDPSMGLYRPFPQPPTSMIPPVPPLPLIRHPMVPTPPAPRFQTPFEYVYNYQQTRADQFTAAANAAPGVMARGATDWAGSYIGTGIGAAAGAALGGPVGARIGSTVGALGGLLLTDRMGFGPAASHMVDNLNPMRAMTMRGAQMQGMSTDWVVGGPHLSPMGMGWNRTASVHAGRLIEDMGYSNSFREETGRAYSVQDLTRITRTAGRAGLLDFAQTPEAMRDEVRKIAKQLRVFMQVANEPDVVEALKQMGQMRSMGLTIPETHNATVNTRMFARMAGTTARGVTETGGLPGAMMFQQAGLTAGLGLQVGQGMYGLARQAVASGAYSVSDIARFGGVQGIAQRNTESALAILQIPMVSAALSTMGKDGFGVHAGNLQKVLSGEVGINDMARMGVENTHDAVMRNGTGALAMFQLQQPEMQDSIGRALGPMGLKMLQMRSVLDAKKMFGFGNSPGDLAQGALAAFGGDSSQAYQFLKEADSPGFFSNIRRQVEVQRRELRGLAKDEYERQQGGWMSRLSRQHGAMYSTAHAFDKLFTNARTGLERTGTFFSEFGEDLMQPSDQSLWRTPDELIASSDKERRALRSNITRDLSEYRKYVGSSGIRADTQRQGSPLFEIGGRGYLHGSANFQNNWMGGTALQDYRMYQGGMASQFGGGILEKSLRLFVGGTGFVDGATTDAAGRDYQKTAFGMTAALHQTETERVSTFKSIEKDFGSKNRAAEIVTGAGRLLAIQANALGEGRGVLGLGHSGKLNSQNFHTAIDEMKRRGQITTAEATKAHTDVDQQGTLFQGMVQEARAMSNFKGKDSLTGLAGQGIGLDAHRQTIEEARTVLARQNEGFLGADDKNSREVSRILRTASEGDSRSVTLASLQAAADAAPSGDHTALDRLKEYREHLHKTLGSEEEFQRIESRASTIGAAVGDNRRYLASAGDLLAGTANITQMEGTTEGYLTKARGALSAEAVQKGSDELFKDWSSVAAAYKTSKGAIGALDELKGLDIAQKLGGDLDKGVRGILNKYETATTQADRDAAAEELDTLMFNRGDTGVGAVAHGGVIAGNENRQSAAASNLDSIQKELSVNFPKAVSAFAEGARLLDDAATRLGQITIDHR